ncbi:MAG: PepSY-associated TM helix domain-containing protein [Silicimonas sp.]
MFRLHAWFGIHVFGILALLSITGTLLVYADQIEAIFVSSERLSTPVSKDERPSFGTLYDQARAYNPEAVVTQINRSHSDWIADRGIVWLPGGQKRFVWFGGENFAVSRETGPTDFYTVLRELHDSFLTRTHIGGIFVTAFSILLTGFLITGIVTYRRFWRGFFRWPSRTMGPRAYWGGVHRLTAVWSLPFLVLISITGLYYLLDRVVAMPYQDLAFERLAERDTPLPAGFDGDALDRAIAAAQAALPGVEIAYVHIPGQAHEGIWLLGGTDQLLTNYESNRILIDPTTLEVIDMLPASEVNAAHRLATIADELHFGTFGGPITEVLWAAFGLISGLLFVAGAMVYANRVAEPGASETATRRIWSATFLTKVGYPLFICAIIAVAVLRYT